LPDDPWHAVTRSIELAQSQFPSGVHVEIATPAGVVYSRGYGGLDTSAVIPIASASKWVTGTVLLRLVDQRVLTLETRTSELLRDRNAQPWSGNMGAITLRQLLSFTSGIDGDVAGSEAPLITLEEAVQRIYDDQRLTAVAPGAAFNYGNTHMRIAARMAEVATGKSWAALFDEQLRIPLGWSATSVYSRGGPNPNPAGTLNASGIEYMRFLLLQLRKGVNGNQRLLPEALVDEQRRDQFAPTTVIRFSPYTQHGYAYHYGLGNWRECPQPNDVAACDAALRVSSTGALGFAPWIDPANRYAAIIMTQQSLSNILPSETLKNELAPLIVDALARNPTVIRAVP
jgi:CubicO group peptidase (beta-lactamase class C family)